ncbi:MAG: hypothetical protein QXX08_07430 [Candidatus Bathyarchaeia archaeon]
MEAELNFKKPFSYGAGALIVLVLSIGLAAIAYGGNLLPLNIFNLPAWIFGPLGHTLLFTR